MHFLNIFQDFYGIGQMNFFTIDYNTGMFYDFVRDWIYIEDAETQKAIYQIFNPLQNNHDKFIINGRLSSYDCDEKEIEEIKEAGAKEVNFVYFPLFSSERTFGFIEVGYAKLAEDLEFDEKFFKMLEILVLLISNAVYNNIVKDHMTKALDFYDAMKNIAKIIESQYELQYIVPQIGEMIDRFLEQHLIYVFLKDDCGYKLAWPNACKQQNIINANKETQMIDFEVYDGDRK